MKKIPALIRTRFKKDAKIQIIPDLEMPRNTGIYLEKGDFIGAHDSKTFFLEEGTIIINGHYKKKNDQYFTAFDEQDYISSHNSGWSLTSTSENSSILCTYYMEDITIVPAESTAVSNSISEYPEEIADTISYTAWSKQFPRASQDECLTLSHAYKTTTEIDFSFPKDYFLVVAKGSALINNEPKPFKTWIHSSSNQRINLKSADGNEVLVFLLF